MKTILLLSFFLIAGVSSAQDAYTFSTFTDLYTEFSDGTSAVDEGWIEPEFSIPIGFDFSEVNVTSNMLSSVDVGGTYSILNETQTDGAVFGVFDFIVDGAILDGEQPSPITYKVEGTAGSQIFKLQLKDCAFLPEVVSSEPSTENRMSFQIWLYEGSNAVEIRFGPSEIPDPTLAFETGVAPLVIFAAGVVNSNAGTAEYGTFLEGDPQNPILGEIDPETFPPGFDAIPESGRVYRFEPNVMSVQEQNATAFDVFPTLVENTLKVDGNFSGLQRYQVHDINGRRLFSGVISPSSTINVGSLSKGVYLLSFENFNGAQKFVKQ